MYRTQIVLRGKPIFRSLRVALLLLVLAAVIPAFALVISLGLRQHQREINDATENVRRLAVLNAVQEERQIQEAFLFLKNQAQRSVFQQNDLKQIRQILPFLHQQNLMFEYLGLASTNGELLVLGRGTTNDNINVTGQSWFTSAVVSNAPAISEYHVDPVTGKESLIFAVPVEQDHGIRSILYGVVDPAWLSKTASQQPIPTDSVILLSDRNGKILFAAPSDAATRGQSLAGMTFYSELTKKFTSISSELNQIPRIYNAVPISIANDKTDFLLIVGLPQRPILSSANKIFRTYLLMLIGFGAVTFLAFWLLSNWVVLDRVRKLVTAAQSLGSGNLQTRTGLPHDVSELGQLARAFDEMADSLQRKETEYEQAVVAERQVESALRESEEMFRSLSASSPLGIFMTDTNGSCTYANPRFRAITQLSFPEIADSFWLRVIHPADLSRLQEEWNIFLHNGQNFFAKARLAGTQRWVLARAARMLTETGRLTGYVGTLEDITERELAEQEIANWKRRYELIATASSQVVYDYDITADTIAWSGSIELVLGYQLPEMTGGLDQWLNLIHPDDRDQFRRQFEGSRDNAVPLDAEYRLRHRMGNYLHIHDRGFFIPDATGKSLHMIGMMEDISDRKRAEESVRESERRFRDLFENSPDAVFVEDQDGNVLDVNPAGCRLHQLPREQLIGSNVLDLVPPNEREDVRRDFAKWFTNEQSYYDGFTYTSTGHCLPVEIRGNLIQYQGRPAVLLHVRDITDRKLAEQALRDSNRRLQDALTELEHTQRQMLQQENLRALGQMASGIAHDFNNALASILGFTELLLQHPQTITDTEKTYRYLQLIHTSANDAANVVNRLREFYRPRDTGEVFANIDLNQIIQQAISLTQPRWKTQAEATGIAIKIETDLNLCPPITGNAAELREAFTNIILNAVDAMPNGGTIMIHTRATALEADVEIVDTGVGMTEEVLQHCLDPFFSTKGASGSGLGLSMVYGILQRHGGNINFASKPGEGTQCTIRFPVKTEIETSFTPSMDKPLDTTSLSPQHILVVDDESHVRNVISAFLATDNHTLEAFEKAEDAIEKSRTQKFQAAIIDRAMPGMSGDQLALALKSIAPQLPVIMLTGFGNLMNEVGERPPGVDMVLSKPISIHQLREALANLLARPHQA
jgi:PAS domain S-box-containing protein